MVSPREYKSFRLHIKGQVPDELPVDEEIPATSVEIALWLEYQVQRAASHAAQGCATLPEFKLLAKAGRFFPGTPSYLRRKYAEKRSS